MTTRQATFILTISLALTACSSGDNKNNGNSPDSLYVDSHPNPQTNKKLHIPEFTIKGRFVLKDASCAGFDFLDSNKIIWRNEFTCFTPDTFAIHWLDSLTFVTKDIIKENENCPPRVSIYKVDSFNGQTLRLLDLWTGWGDYTNDTLLFTRWTEK